MRKYKFCLAMLLLSVALQAQHEAVSNPAYFRLASCQFPVSDLINQNADWIIRQMIEAADSGARVAHFPECSLSGYPGVDMESLEGFDWSALRSWTDSVMLLADRLDLWVILGSIHELGEGLKPMNSLYVISPEGKIEDRYDKRFCTKGDLEHFSPGEHFSVVNIQGIKCGFLICFDVRFPELYREYKKLDVDFIFQSFYNARQKPGGIHPKIMPVTAQARASTNHFYMSLTNSSSPGSWPCHFITPDGLVSGIIEKDRPGILISDVSLADKFYDASRRFRENALEGKLSSGEAPDVPAYSNRKSL